MNGIEITWYGESGASVCTTGEHPAKIGDIAWTGSGPGRKLSVYPMFGVSRTLDGEFAAVLYLMECIERPDPERVAAIGHWLPKNTDASYHTTWTNAVALAKARIDADIDARIAG